MDDETAAPVKGMEHYHGEGPKWRLEHAATGQAGCQQASCKRDKVKIAKGELRIGTHTLFDRDSEEPRWYMAWRHWGCATSHQIKGLIGVTEDDATKAPGYDRLSTEAQEQVRLAFENGKIVDKDFKGVNIELAKVPKRYGEEIRDATGYKVDVATRGTASCRKSDCPMGAVKIAKGELRLGISVSYDGEHESFVYKHWACISKFDLDAVQELFEEDSFDGIDTLPNEFETVVIETLETGKVVEPPKPEVPAAKPKRAKKKKVADDDSEIGESKPRPKRKTKAAGKKKAEDDSNSEGTSETQPRPKCKGKKRPSEELDDSSEPEYVPKKTRSRAAPVEVIDPAIARIEAMAEGLRTEAAK
ncbi:hypothetical protein DE146DRAFT_751396 [Phaeosphaeria sp. MPI-PUGE-AT-0046c]|nr:hypothetical protein DE146DRAFT_751396 [Phaeosphaeria sp. MPI-PUGE-AT-0046c]